MGKEITFDEIRNNKEIANYVQMADASLAAQGFTDHSYGHVLKCCKVVKDILTGFSYSPREIRLGQIAAYMHDIGNGINRVGHGQVGAMMAFNILTRLEMEPKDISPIIAAIGNHDESAAYPVNSIAAALIIADKTDVRRTRVRSTVTPEEAHGNIHLRVNYAVISSQVEIDKENRAIICNMTIDTEITDVMDYFEIFMERMKLCKLAAKHLDARFKLIINGLELI
jgi:metal-dependent HD superfamily phosphatase/phosphodiesterase